MEDGRNRDSSFVGLDTIRQKHAQQVEKFQSWVDGGKWDVFHRQHFDWWTFPIELPSTNYGLGYSVGHADVADLMFDPAFTQRYRKGVELVALSWGWDIHKQQPVENPAKHQCWGRHDIRLRKVGQSLLLFDQKDLHSSLDKFVAHQVEQGVRFDTSSSRSRGDWPFAAGK